MIKIIEKDPPTATGNTRADIKALENYLVYLKEQLNWILTIITKNQNGGT